MEISKTVAISLCVGVLSGCSTPVRHMWNHPSRPAAMIKLDIGLCAKDAWIKYPERQGWVSANDGYFTSATSARSECTTYKNKTTCTHTPAEPARYVSSSRVKGDENEEDRHKAITKCVAGKDAAYKCSEIRGDSRFTSNECLGGIEPKIPMSGGVKVGGGDELVVYWFPSTILRKGEIASVIVLADRKNPKLIKDGKYSKSVVAVIEFDCKKSLNRQIVTNDYSGPMATGDDIGLGYTNEEVPFEPVSADNLLKQAVCSDK